MASAEYPTETRAREAFEGAVPSAVAMALRQREMLPKELKQKWLAWLAASAAKRLA